MKWICSILWVLPMLALSAQAELVSETWGGKGADITYPNKAKMHEGAPPRLVFDLSALPRDAKVYNASLRAGENQPRDPIQIFMVENLEGNNVVHGEKALQLEPPRYNTFNATEAAQRWVRDPASNLGFALVRTDGVEVGETCLVILYEGQAKKIPDQVSEVKAFHHDGQTFIVFKELPAYRPPAEAIIWVDQFAQMKTTFSKESGNATFGQPRIPAVKLKDLRDLQGLAVRDVGLGHTQTWPPFKRVKEVPDIQYRVYRSQEKITIKTIKDATYLGLVKALAPYQDRMLVIQDEGEYYNPHEWGDSVIPTVMISETQAVLPGENYFVHTPAEAGNFYYAVTSVQDGTENVSQINAGNSLDAAVGETPGLPKPVLQYINEGSIYGQKDVKVQQNYHAFWLAPPFSNLPDNQARIVAVAVPSRYTAPGPLLIQTGPDQDRFFRPSNHLDPSTAQLLIGQDVAYGGDLCYNEGRGTLRSFKECKVDYFSERYVSHLSNWAIEQWKCDRNKISGECSHYAIRHPEIYRKLYSGPYGHDFDMKWNPGSNSLAERLGPAELAFTVDGHKAWDVFDLNWFLKQDPTREIPFLYCVSKTGKDSGHAVEFGWQDDPRGLAALRDARQPFCASWGGEHFRREVREVYNSPLDKTLPAFSNCSLDNNPGNGDVDDGDPWGCMNGWIAWDYADVVDEKDRWAATVFVASDCPDAVCTVDITPRHCSTFKAIAGQKFKWVNLNLKENNKEIESGEIIADPWGLVTLKRITASKDRNRIMISAE